MEENNIVNVLIEREGYTPQMAAAMAKEAESLDSDLRPLFDSWIEGRQGNDWEESGIKLSTLQEKVGMNYGAALLTLDWLKKEPSVALPIIQKLIKVGS